MSNDEHERELGRLVLKLREKEVKQHCLRDKANGLSQILKAVMKLHEQQQHDESLLFELDKLPEDCQIVGTFRSLVEVKAEIENLKNNLCLKWND
jgi:hypothetical protein